MCYSKTRYRCLRRHASEFRKMARAANADKATPAQANPPGQHGTPATHQETDHRRDGLSGFRPFRSEWRLFFRGRSCHPVSLFLHAQEMTPVLCVDGQLIRGSYAIVKFLATEMCARNQTCRCRNFRKFRRGRTLLSAALIGFGHSARN